MRRSHGGDVRPQQNADAEGVRKNLGGVYDPLSFRRYDIALLVGAFLLPKGELILVKQGIGHTNPSGLKSIISLLKLFGKILLF